MRRRRGEGRRGPEPFLTSDGAADEGKRVFAVRRDGSRRQAMLMEVVVPWQSAAAVGGWICQGERKLGKGSAAGERVSPAVTERADGEAGDGALCYIAGFGQGVGKVRAWDSSQNMQRDLLLAARLTPTYSTL